MTTENPILETDCYKVSHKGFMDSEVTRIYSNFTARSNKHFPRPLDGKSIVFFGLQHFIKDYLIKSWNDNFFQRNKDEVINEFKEIIYPYVGEVDTSHFEALHDLGYLPIRIKALNEGVRIPVKVPMLTIENTHDEFAWLTNYLETVLSAELWKPVTVATLIAEYKEMVNKFALETTGKTDTQFLLHDFAFRGMSGRHDAAVCGAAFLLSTWGSDTIPALKLLRDEYNAGKDGEPIAFSVSASEHSIASLGIALKGELESMRDYITKAYPQGIVSLVSDTLNFWKVITEYASRLKEDILNRGSDADGLHRVVFRPDTGNPVDIIVGKIRDTYDNKEEFFRKRKGWALLLENPEYDEDAAKAYCRTEDKFYQILRNEETGTPYLKEISPTPEEKGALYCLWEIFGGTVNEKGYKELNPKVGLIYGDSMTPIIAREMMYLMKAKGFATTNVVFGVGSYTTQYLTRDSLGMAMKATAAKTGDKWIELYKDPVTDKDSVKKSARGLLTVYKDENGEYYLKDRVSEEESKQGELKVVFEDGILKREHTLTEIRKRVGVL